MAVYPNSKVELLFVAITVGVIASEFSRFVNVEHLVWIPDRDRINDVEDYLSANIFAGIYNYLTKKNIRLGLGKAASEEDKWFKEFIRIPDYIVGTLADVDLENLSVSSLKFAAMLTDYFKGNAQNNLVFKLWLEPNNDFGTGRLVFSD